MALVSMPTVVDDLDASTEGVDTYSFALQGVTYEIDLSAPNADKLFALLNPFIQAGRRLPKNATASNRDRPAGKPTTRTPTGRRRTTHRPVSEPTAPELRNWWAEKAQELDLPTFRTRGAIPQQVRDAYAATHSQH